MDGQALIARARELKKTCLGCQDCALGQVQELDGYDPHVYAVGNVGSKVFFIAEAPGFDETRLKKPLIGRSGGVFNEYVLGGLGLQREDVWITNTVLCHPPGNRKPTKNELQACSRHLEAQFDLIKPKLVVIMGTTPMSAMIGIDSGITKLAGEVHRSKRFDVEVFILAHPSWFLRNHDFATLAKHVALLKKVYDNLK